MVEQVNPLAFCNLLQQTLRSLCLHENSNWVYAVYWRILPRNFPPPKWEDQGGPAFGGCRGNRRNWILVWEDGFCNFAATTNLQNDIGLSSHLELSNYKNTTDPYPQALTPELFFKMSHEIYRFGESLIGKVAAEQSHQWVFPGAQDEQDFCILPLGKNSADILSHPRTWEAQFQSGIKTIALIAMREGVVQLGAVKQIVEDLNYVVQLRKKFSYLECVPGFLLPHPSSCSSISSKLSEEGNNINSVNFGCYWPILDGGSSGNIVKPSHGLGRGKFAPLRLSPSTSNFEGFLSKLPPVLPAASPPASLSNPSCVKPTDQYFMGSVGDHGRDNNIQEDEQRSGVEISNGVQWATWV